MQPRVRRVVIIKCADVDISIGSAQFKKMRMIKTQMTTDQHSDPFAGVQGWIRESHVHGKCININRRQLISRRSIKTSVCESKLGSVATAFNANFDAVRSKAPVAFMTMRCSRGNALVLLPMSILCRLLTSTLKCFQAVADAMNCIRKDIKK